MEQQLTNQLAEQLAEQLNEVMRWTFDANGSEVSAMAMTENQARMFAAEQTSAQIGQLVRVERA